MFMLYRGNTRIPVHIGNRGCRTQAQLEAVESLLPEVDFVCGNPFEGEFADSEYNCSFAFLFRGIDGKLHLANITPTGRITGRVTA